MIEDIIKAGVIEPEELQELLSSGAHAVRLIDASYVLPGSTDKPHQNYLRKRIGNAVFFDIDDICDHDSDLPHMLPEPQGFSMAVRQMGIANDDLVVVYGQSGIIMGPARVWWMFRIFGHNNVCVLNGGLPAWINAGGTLSTELPQSPARSDFEATFRPEMVCDMKEVDQALQAGDSIVIDTRPSGRFNGTDPEPRPTVPSGHMPGAQNIPCIDFIMPDNGKIRPQEELHEILRKTGYDTNKPVISTCGSGATACVVALIFHHLGLNAPAVYDGAWSEWAMTNIQK